MTVGDLWTAKQNHWKSEAKEDHQLYFFCFLAQAGVLLDPEPVQDFLTNIAVGQHFEYRAGIILMYLVQAVLFFKKLLYFFIILIKPVLVLRDGYPKVVAAEG